MAQVKYSFIVKRDNNADASRRFILSVRENGVCVQAPRFAYLSDALEHVAYVLTDKEVTNSKVEIKL